MTSHKTQISELLADIDSLLTPKRNRLPWGIFTQEKEPQQILEKIRDFLASLQNEDSVLNLSAKERLLLLPSADTVGNSEPDSQLTQLLQPLRADLEAIRQQRQDLMEEIRQLEQRRLHDFSLVQQQANQQQVIAEFSHVLMSRLQEILSPQLFPTAINATRQGLLESAEVQNDDHPTTAESTQFYSESLEQTQKLQLLQSQLDRRVLDLDTTVNVVFQSLHSNIQSYQESLSQALLRMYGKSLEGEELFDALVSNIKQQLQRTPPSTTLSVTQDLDLPNLDDNSTTLDLDLVLESLDTDWQSSPTVGEVTVTDPPENRDEVDDLYQSLFGTNITTPPLVNQSTPKSENFAQPVAPVQPTATSDSIAQASPVKPTPASDHVLPVANQPTPASDKVLPAANQPTPASDNVLSAAANQPTPVSDDIRQQVADQPTPASDHVRQVKVTPSDKLPVAERTTPLEEDTIALLTDLRVDYSQKPKIIQNDVVATPQVAPPKTYIPASPKENLLSPNQPEVAPISEIFVNDQTLHQLDEDLANLETQIPSPSVNILKSTEVVTPVKTPEISLPVETPPVPTAQDAAPSTPSPIWYLGIDFGTTGISAALLNRSTSQLFPLYWSATDIKERSFRLPSVAYLPHDSSSIAAETTTSSTQLKPYLQVGIPYQSVKSGKWEPVLQLSESLLVPLIWVRRSLAKLLSTLNAAATHPNTGLTAGADDLKNETFTQAITHLVGVIVTCPNYWSEQYRFNVTEAVLASKIVSRVEQVFFVEEAIAAVLSQLPGIDGVEVKLPPLAITHSQTDFPGATLALNIGATATEMTLVEIPRNIQNLRHSDFLLHSFAYAGNALDQDIICQLLYPPRWRQPRNTPADGNKSEHCHWQPTIPGLDSMRWGSLELEQLELPRPGEPDLEARIRLQQRLDSSVLGQALIDAAIALKFILQHQDTFSLALADCRWVLQRRDLESLVFAPFVQRLNRELNRLLVAKGIPTAAIAQVICTGGTVGLSHHTNGVGSAIARWLRQKLPSATIIQDIYRTENGTPTCSRVACGLAMLPLHPLVLDTTRHQYTDYFLVMELLRILPDRPFSFGDIVKLLEGHGINTASCESRIVAFLENQLPPGLIPNSIEKHWLTPASLAGDYRSLAVAPLFEKQANSIYRPNVPQLQCLRSYLEAMTAGAQQSLLEPNSANLMISMLEVSANV